MAGKRLALLWRMSSASFRSASGFSLLEILVATSILVTALAGIAELCVASVRLTGDSGRRAAGLDAAQAKLEELRARGWAYGPGGEIISDPVLAPSPGGSLQENLAGYVDFVGPDGRPAADVSLSTLVRRWAVTAIDGRVPEAIAIEVCVFRAPASAVTVIEAEACLATVRSRQP